MRLMTAAGALAPGGHDTPPRWSSASLSAAAYHCCRALAPMLGFSPGAASSCEKRPATRRPLWERHRRQQRHAESVPHKSSSRERQSRQMQMAQKVPPAAGKKGQPQQDSGSYSRCTACYPAMAVNATTSRERADQSAATAVSPSTRPL